MRLSIGDHSLRRSGEVGMGCKSVPDDMVGLSTRGPGRKNEKTPRLSPRRQSDRASQLAQGAMQLPQLLIWMVRSAASTTASLFRSAATGMPTPGKPQKPSRIPMSAEFT